MLLQQYSLPRWLMCLIIREFYIHRTIWPVVDLLDAGMQAPWPKPGEEDLPRATIAAGCVHLIAAACRTPR